MLTLSKGLCRTFNIRYEMCTVYMTIAVSGASGQMEGVSVNGKTSDGAVPAGSGSTASFQNMMATSGSAASLYSDTGTLHI